MPRRHFRRPISTSSFVKSSYARRLRVEQLEDRRMLAAVSVGNTLDVTNGDVSSIGNLIANDGGDGISLREAVAAANASPGANTITFAPLVFSGSNASLIRFTSGPLVITDTLAIDASTATEVTVTGDALGNDITNAQNITDIDASLANDASSLDDNSQLFNFSSASGTGELTIEGLTITGGTDSGIRANSGALMTVISSTVSGNTSNNRGGGIYSGIDAVTLTNSTVSGNRATATFLGEGGGIYSRFGNLTLTNSTVSGNAANYLAGGVFSRGVLEMRNSTVFGNESSGNIGGVYQGDDPATVENSIIAGNTGGTVPDLYFNGPLALGRFTISHSLIGDNAGNAKLTEAQTPDADGNLIGSTAGSGIINPLLGSLGDNGGPTATHSLSVNSPALNAGDPTIVFDANEFDQRDVGFARVRFGRIDIGAYELQFPSQGLEVSTAFDIIDSDLTTGDISLREAILLANLNPGPDTITFSSLFNTAQTIALGSQLPTITDDLTITGPGAALLTIDAGGGDDGTIGNGDGFRIFNIDNGDLVDRIDVTISGLTITGGDGDDMGGPLPDTAGRGGAIRNAERLTIMDSVITGNAAAGDFGYGGAIYSGDLSETTILNSTLSNNQAGQSGGAIWDRGTTSITRSSLIGNRAYGLGTAGRGGGILNSGSLTVAESTLSGNSGFGGGAIANYGVANISGSTFAANTSSEGGGALLNLGTANVELSTLSGNTGSAGGGIGNLGTLNLDSSTITGGGIYSLSPTTVSLDNTIVAGSNALQGSGDFSGSHNLIEDGSRLSSFTSSIAGDPLLGPLADNGGPTPTRTLLPGSPALDVGDDSTLLTEDQRGFARDDGNGVDIGAFEVQTLVVNSAADTDDMDAGNGVTTLREAIRLTNETLGYERIAFGSLFDTAQTIDLVSQLPTITDDLTITGPTDETTTIDGGGNGRLFTIDDGTAGLLDVEIHNLRLTGGLTVQSDGSVAAGRGGAIFNLENLAIANSTITGNSTDVDGGAVWSRYGALAIEGSTIDNNTAAFRGGALYVRESSDVQISGSTISGNTLTSGSGNGGAIQNRDSNVTLTSSTVTDNTAGDRGGGLAFHPTPGTFTLFNTIVAGNHANSDNDISGAVTANFSLIEDTTGVTITGGDNVTGLDPLLGPLADNGGSSRTHALLPGSPAIDAGDGPLHYYRFEGNASDSTGGNNGTANSAVDLSATTEVLGSTTAAEFDGQNGFVQLASNLSEIDGGASNTVEAWVQVPSSATGRVGVILGNFEDSSTLVGNWEIHDDGQLRVFWDNGNNSIGTNLFGTTDLRDDKWHHIAIVRDTGPNNEFRAYIDGNIELLNGPGSTANIAGENFSFSALHRIGSDNRNGASAGIPFQGSIDELAIYDRVLTEREIRARAQGNIDQRGPGFARVELGQIDIGAYEAPTLIVDTTSDADDGVYTAGEFSLREAISFANGLAGHNEITFDPTVFTGGAASLIRLTSGSELEITDTVTIDASTATDVVISGDVMGNDTPVAGTFITDVDANTNVGDNVRVLNFTAASGDLTLSDVTVTGGHTTGNTDDGGGIRFGGDSVSTLTLHNSTVSGNSITGSNSDGGGIRAFSGAVTLTSSTVSGNSSGRFGAGISTDSGAVTLTNSAISVNSNLSDGGGIDTSSGDITLTSSTVSNNSGGRFGGGISTSSGAVMLTDSTVSDNSTMGSNSDGGGIFTSTGSVTLTGSTVSGNSTTGENSEGGGVFTSSGAVTLTSSTVTDNNAAQSAGGGVFVANPPSGGNQPFIIENSIVAGNTDDGAAPDLQADPDSTLDVTFSLIGDNTGTLLVASASPDTNGNLIGSSVSVINPLLSPLADNGGPTQTHALLLGSPAIDAGDPGVLFNPVEFDQRGDGFFRVGDGGGGLRTDIGAYELQVAQPDLPGDYNLNGTVDAADYTVWRDALGLGGLTPFSGADGNGDGEVTQADYDLWTANFGNVLTPPAQAQSVAGTAEGPVAVAVQSGRSVESSVDNREQLDAGFALLSLSEITASTRKSDNIELTTSASSQTDDALLLLHVDGFDTSEGSVFGANDEAFTKEEEAEENEPLALALTEL